MRGFADAKQRLAGELTALDRGQLMQEMAEGVVRAAHPAPTAVVSSAPEVVAWAESLGLIVIGDPGSLDGAAAAGLTWARSESAARVVVAHADLPLVTTLADLTAPGPAPVAVVVACHRGDGTPLLSLPTDAPFRFAYGVGSFARHVAEAERLGLEVVQLLDDPTLRHDVDAPEDLQAARGLAAPRQGAAG